MTKIDIKSLRALVKEAVQKEAYSYLLEQPELLDEKSILKNKHPFKALFVFGPAGAGKSYLVKNVLNVPNDFKVSNPDERIEEVFPAFGISMKFANAKEGGDPELEKLQQKSREILQNASRAHTANLIAIANPLIFDTTGEAVKKMSARIEALTKLGYDVGVVMINVPTQASVERDAQRDRTVGKSRTTGISQEYQQAVVQNRGYYEALSGMEGVTMLAPDVYNNIFDLNTGELLKKPTVITPDMLPDDLNPEKNPEAFQQQKAIITQTVDNLNSWLQTPVSNAAGQKVLKGMKALVKKSGGKLGQNMNDLVIAMAHPDLAGDSDIVSAAKHLSSLGGVTAVVKKKKGGGTGIGAAPSETAPAIQGAIRGKKKTGSASIRDLTKESIGWGDLLELVRSELLRAENEK